MRLVPARSSPCKEILLCEYLYHRSPKNCIEPQSQVEPTMPRNPQLSLNGLTAKSFKKAYGGSLYKTREGRRGPRPLATKQSMHLVLRSSQARGAWSFLKPKNSKMVLFIVTRFAQKYGVRIRSMANVGNHLHFQIQLANRRTYHHFIRATTGTIALQITGRSRWNNTAKGTRPLKFWDARPFTRIVTSLREKLTLKHYIQVNQLEGFGYTKNQARFLLEWELARRPG
jgi:REP element-mobilizing transposase RayT